MDDPNQIEVPASFQQLYTSPSGTRLTERMSVVRERYELCEDVAQSLVDHAAMALHKSGAHEREVLDAIRTGLEGDDSVVKPPEAAWVVRRLAELSGWEDPGMPDAASPPA